MSKREREFVAELFSKGAYTYYQVWTDASIEDIELVEGVETVYSSWAGTQSVYDVFIDPRYDVISVLDDIKALTTAPTEPDYSKLVEEGVLAE